MEDEKRISEDPGRRGYDKQKCPNCDVLWTHLAQDRQANKEHICGKIKEVKIDVEAMVGKMTDLAKSHEGFVPRWMFLSAFGLMLLAAGWWFNSFGNTVKEQQADIKEKVGTIHRRISDIDNHRESLKDGMMELKWSVNNLSDRMGKVEDKLRTNGGDKSPK